MNETTNFPEGVSSFGIPMIGSGNIPVTKGTYWFVNGATGNDGNTGIALNASLKTIAAAVTRAGVDDVILVLPGSYTDVVTITKAGVRLIALGTASNSVKWTSATDTISCTIAAANVEVAGFKFTPPAFTAGVPASIALSNAGYAHIHHNRFQGQTGSYYAIYSAVCNSDNVIIENNDFEYMNTASHGAGIWALEAGGLSYSDWQVKNNKFSSCVVGAYFNGRVALVQGNHFAQEGINASGAVASVTTTKLSLSGVSGTSSGANLVHGNYFGGTYSIAGGYIPGATVDDWAGNFNIAGVTAALPA